MTTATLSRPIERGSLFYKHQRIAAEGWFRSRLGLPIESVHETAARAVNVDFHPDANSSLTIHLRTAAERAEYRAQTKINDVSGGFAVPTSFADAFELAADAHNSFRRFGTILSVDHGRDMPWPTSDDRANEGEIVVENASTPTTTQDAMFAQVTFRGSRFSSKKIICSRSLWDDAGGLFQAMLGAICGERIARAANRHFTVGTAAAGPAGILTNGVLGVTAANAGAITADEVVNLMYSVHATHRESPGASFMLHSDVMKYIALLKDGNGAPIFNRDLRLLCGHPILFNEHMPSSIATGNKTIAFGDFSKFCIRENPQLTVRALLDEPSVVELDQVVFIALQTIDGRILNAGSNPIKYLQQP